MCKSQLKVKTPLDAFNEIDKIFHHDVLRLVMVTQAGEAETEEKPLPPARLHRK